MPRFLADRDVLHARGQRRVAGAVRGADRPGTDRRPRGAAGTRPARGGLAVPRRPRRPAPLGPRGSHRENRSRPFSSTGNVSTAPPRLSRTRGRSGRARRPRAAAGAPVYARTTATRVDPVYVAEVPGAVILSDRAMWAAWTADHLDDHDPLLACALLNPGFPLGSATPFRGVSALSRSTIIQVLSGAASRTAAEPAATSFRRSVPRSCRWRGRRARRRGRAAARGRQARRAQPDRRQGQPPGRRRAGQGRGSCAGADTRVRRSPGCA